MTCPRPHPLMSRGRSSSEGWLEPKQVSADNCRQWWGWDLTRSELPRLSRYPGESRGSDRIIPPVQHRAGLRGVCRLHELALHTFIQVSVHVHVVALTSFR